MPGFKARSFVKRRPNTSASMPTATTNGQKPSPPCSDHQRSCSDTSMESCSTHSAPMQPVSHIEPTTQKAGAVADSQFAKNERRTSELMNDLRSIGVDSDLPVPVIAIVGSQSVGKSSVINNISGITFPRASGTCTRCPMECRMVFDPNSEWSCQVSLRKVEDTAGAPVKAYEVPFGSRLTAREEVEPMLRKAQLAVMNPDRPIEEFVHFDLEKYDRDVGDNGPCPVHSDQRSFTRNVVAIEIKGPEVVNLTFIDLPGMIQSVREGEDRDSPQIIKDLIISYIKRPSTIMLLAVSMETEYENQLAAALAKDFDPAGKRTIGVLTKPDIARPGTCKQYIPLIRGEREALVHGWYVVKSPEIDPEAAPPLPHEALAQENAFFASIHRQEHWKGLGEDFAHRLGCSNLTHKLSELLCQLNREALPSIKTTIIEALKNLDTRLEALPPEPEASAASIVTTLVTDFSGKLITDLKGDAVQGKDGFAQRRNMIWQYFKEIMAESAPVFKVTPHSRPQDGPLPDFAYEDGDFSQIYDENTDFDEQTCLVMSLGEVQTQQEFARTDEIGGNEPYAVRQKLMQLSTKAWPENFKIAFDKAVALLHDYVEQLVKQLFGYYHVGGLNTSVGMMLSAHIDKLASQVRQHLDMICNMERLVFTQNDHYFQSYKSKFLGIYASQRQTTSTLGEDDLSALRSIAARLGATGNQDELMSRLRDPDPHEAQLDLMAECRAFWQIAFKRVIDAVPMVIQLELFNKFRNDVQAVILTTLNPSGPDAEERCQELVRESDDIVFKRKELRARTEKLLEAQVKVAKF